MKEILTTYCIGSIPVDSSQIHIYDVEEKKNKNVIDERQYVNDIKNKKKIKLFKGKSFKVNCFADGAYPCYVVINQNKLVKKILIELTNSCGWGSSLYEKNFRIKKLESEINSKDKVPKDFQMDMVAGVRNSVDFSSSHRVTYAPWEEFDIFCNDKIFFKNKKNTKIKLGEISIKSNFLCIDDFHSIKSSEIKKIKLDQKKALYERTKTNNRFIFPLKKKKYPIYLYYSDLDKEEILKNINTENFYSQSKPMYPILSIENIEDCKLEKTLDSLLIFTDDKNKFRGASSNFGYQSDMIAEDPENSDCHLKLCQLDLGDFSNLEILGRAIPHFQEKTPIKIITLRHFHHIKDWSILLKFFDIPEIHFDNCKINFESDKKNQWLDVMSRFYYNRKKDKYLNKNFGDLKVFVNGKKVFDE